MYPQILDSFYLKNTSKRKPFSFPEAQTLAGVRVPQGVGENGVSLLGARGGPGGAAGQGWRRGRRGNALLSLSSGQVWPSGRRTGAGQGTELGFVLQVQPVVHPLREVSTSESRQVSGPLVVFTDMHGV